MKCEDIKIKLNSQGDSVKELQTYLRACKIYKGELDGVCGPYMVEAIKQLQNRQGNTPDGIWGPKTCLKSDLNKKDRLSSPSTKKDSSNVCELLIQFKRQPDIVTCGPTSLSMCYSYYNENIDIEKLRTVCHTNKNGTSPQDLIEGSKAINKSYKLIEEPYAGFNQIVSHLDDHNPMIIQLQTIPELGYKGSYGHYVALTGYNKKSMSVKVADPSRSLAWFVEPVLKKAIQKRLILGPIKPIKVLKKVWTGINDYWMK